MAEIPGAREIPDPEAEMERLAAARKQVPDMDHDGIKVGDPVKVTIVGYVGDLFMAAPGTSTIMQKCIRLDYGGLENGVYIVCGKPGVTIVKA